MVEAPERPRCMCGQPMIQMNGTNTFCCAHCDRPCDKTEDTCVNHGLYARRLRRRIEETNPPKNLRNQK